VKDFSTQPKRRQPITRTHGLEMEKEALKNLATRASRLSNATKEAFRKRVLPQTKIRQGAPRSQTRSGHDRATQA